MIILSRWALNFCSFHIEADRCPYCHNQYTDNLSIVKSRSLWLLNLRLNVVLQLWLKFTSFNRRNWVALTFEVKREILSLGYFRFLHKYWSQPSLKLVSSMKSPTLVFCCQEWDHQCIDQYHYVWATLILLLLSNFGLISVHSLSWLPRLTSYLNNLMPVIPQRLISSAWFVLLQIHYLLDQTTINESFIVSD